MYLDRCLAYWSAGPINTWSRTAYIQPTDPASSKSGDPKAPGIKHNSSSSEGGGEGNLIQEWTNIDNNFVMVGPKMGALYGPVSFPSECLSNSAPRRFLSPNLDLVLNQTQDSNR